MIMSSCMHAQVELPGPAYLQAEAARLQPVQHESGRSNVGSLYADCRVRSCSVVVVRMPVRILSQQLLHMLG